MVGQVKRKEKGDELGQFKKPKVEDAMVIKKKNISQRVEGVLKSHVNLNDLVDLLEELDEFVSLDYVDRVWGLKKKGEPTEVMFTVLEVFLKGISSIFTHYTLSGVFRSAESMPILIQTEVKQSPKVILATWFSEQQSRFITILRQLIINLHGLSTIYRTNKSELIGKTEVDSEGDSESEDDMNLDDSEPGVLALTVWMKMVEFESKQNVKLTLDSCFAVQLMDQLIGVLIDTNTPLPRHIINAFTERYLLEYDDVRYYTYASLSAHIQLRVRDKSHSIDSKVDKQTNPGVSLLSVRLFEIMSAVYFPSEQKHLDTFLSGITQADQSSQSGQQQKQPRYLPANKQPKGINGTSAVVSARVLIQPVSTINNHAFMFELTAHRTVFSACWIAFLGLYKSDLLLKRVLVVLPKKVIPFLMKPEMLIGFVSSAFDQGGPIGILALTTLFELITKYGMDYPAFYPSVYNYITPENLGMKFRDRFLGHLVVFLNSSLLPSYLVASFVKRLLRACLFSHPGAIIGVLPIVYNLLNKHPQLMPMIHRRKDMATDVFDNITMDPYTSNALESSLWELDILRKHYIPVVEKLSETFSNPFKKNQYLEEKFLGNSYESLFNKETSKSVILPVITEHVQATSFLDGIDDLWRY